MRNPSRSIAVALVLAIALLAAPSARAQQPRPADPLTAEETQRLIRIATEHALSRESLVRDRYALVGTEVVHYKPQTPAGRPGTPEDAGRYGSVLFFRYDKNQGIRVLVDLVRNTGVEITTIPATAMPIGREEVERAARLALANAVVARILGGEPARFRVADPGSDEENTIEGLRVIAATDADPCFRNRCVDLFFRRGGYYIVGQRITVDLTTNTVRVTSQR